MSGDTFPGNLEISKFKIFPASATKVHLPQIGEEAGGGRRREVGGGGWEGGGVGWVLISQEILSQISTIKRSFQFSATLEKILTGNVAL